MKLNICLGLVLVLFIGSISSAAYLVYTPDGKIVCKRNSDVVSTGDQKTIQYDGDWDNSYFNTKKIENGSMVDDTSYVPPEPASSSNPNAAIIAEATTAGALAGAAAALAALKAKEKPTV